MKKALLILSLLFLTHDAWAVTRYWVGGGATANWNATGNTNWGTASNTQDNASVPTTGDIVIFDGVGTGASNCTLNVSTSVLASVDFTGYANTLTHNASVNLNVGGNLTFASGMTYTLGSSSTSAIVLSSTWALTSAGKTTGNITVSGTGTVVDAITSTGTFAHSSGTLHFDGATDNSGLAHSILTISIGSSGSVLMGTATYAVSGSWLYSTSGSTFSAGTSHITFSNTAPTTTFNNKTYYDVTFSNATTLSLNSTNSSLNVTFNNLSITGSAVKTASISLPNPITVTNQFTITGNSAINRPIFTTSSIGTARVLTINSTTVSTNNVDFRDITFARTTAGGLDLTNGGANLIGDCGGNSRTGGDGTVTFTTPATQTYTLTGVNDNWDTVAKWSSSRMPLPQEDAVLNLESGRTLNTNGVPRIGKNISFSNAGSLSQTASTTTTNYGSIDFTNAFSVSISNGHTFEGRGPFTLTSAGKSFAASVTIDMIGGTLTLQDALTVANTATLTLTNGTLIDGGFSHSIGIFTSTNTNTRALTMTGTWTMTRSSSTNGIFWNTSTITGMTFTAAGSTIIQNPQTTAKNFVSGALTFGNLTLGANGGNSGAFVFVGSSTFNKITINAPRTVTFTSGTTQTVSNFVATGTAGNVITINSSSAGSAATLTKSGGGTVSCDYLSLRDNTGSPSNTWYYGNNSTVVSNVNGWNSGNPPSGQAYNMLLGVG